MNSTKHIADVELMRHFDGELDEKSSAEVAALLEHDADARAKIAGLAIAGDVVRASVAEDKRGDNIAGAVMALIEAEPDRKEEGKVVELTRDLPTAQPANDNARLIYTIAAAAAAVAAGLYFWSNASSESAGPTASAPTAQPAVESPAPTPSPAEVNTEGDEEAGVEIASVDFGSGVSGSVFYTSAGEKGTSATAVVWVTDSGE